MFDRSAKRSFLLVLLVALVAGALLGVACHLVWADHRHDPNSCAVCTWFHFKGWITTALVLLVCFVLQRVLCSAAHGFFSFSGVRPSSRSPPLF